MGLISDMQGKIRNRISPRTAHIKKCRPQDKKPGRKYPVSEQEYCLWDQDEEKILMAGPKSEVEEQEKAVQYFKHAGSTLIVDGQVFRRAAVQLFIPPTHFRTAQASIEEVRNWATQVAQYTYDLKEQTEKVLERIAKKGDLIKKLVGVYPKLAKREDSVKKLEKLAEAYGTEGVQLVEAGNTLSELVEERIRWAGIITDQLKKFQEAGLAEDDTAFKDLKLAGNNLDVFPAEEA